MGKSKLLLSIENDGLALTHDEYAEADFQPPWRYERVNGRLLVMTPPGYEHHVTLGPIRDHLGAYRLSHPEIVEHVFQESWTEINEDADRLPDIAVYLKSNPDKRRIPERIADVIFEIVSEGIKDRKRDYEDKRADYQRIGVQEYVIVDRFERRVTVLRLVEGEYQEAVLSPEDKYTSPLLPGLQGII